MKKILATGIALLSVVPTTFAQINSNIYFQIEAPKTVQAGEFFDATIRVVDSNKNALTNFTGSIIFKTDWEGDMYPLLNTAIPFSEEDRGIKKFSKWFAFAKEWNRSLFIQDSNGNNLSEFIVNVQSAKKNDSLNSATVYGRVDNRDNPMNTSLGTTEDQYAKSSTGTTISVNPVATRPVIDDKIAREMWLRFYCSIVEKGFVWTGDIALFANQQTCGLGGKVATPLVSVVDLTPKLVVVETPAVTTGTGEILSLQSKDSDKVTFAEYKNFAKILKDLNSDEIKKLPENEAALHVMAKLNALLLLSPNISDEVKFSVVKPFEAGFKKDEKVYAEIKKFAELEKILKLYDDKKDGEIVIARSPLLVNDIVNVELKDGKISQNMIDNRLEIQLFDKNATLVEMSDFEVEYKNLPAGIKVETPYSKGLLMVTFTADYTPKQEKIQILIKNKKTGAVVSKELTLVPRITEKTDTLASMTAFEVQEGLK